MVRNLSVTHSHVYVISGSIFDENADGHRDDDGNITRLELSLCLVDCPKRSILHMSQVAHQDGTYPSLPNMIPLPPYHRWGGGGR